MLNDRPWYRHSRLLTSLNQRRPSCSHRQFRPSSAADSITYPLSRPSCHLVPSSVTSQTDRKSPDNPPIVSCTSALLRGVATNVLAALPLTNLPVRVTDLASCVRSMLAGGSKDKPGKGLGIQARRELVFILALQPDVLQKLGSCNPSAIPLH